jgi:hypothetical protein
MVYGGMAASSPCSTTRAQGTGARGTGYHALQRIGSDLHDEWASSWPASR